MSYRDPSLALQNAVYEALKGLAGGSVFYDVPEKQSLPYIYFGDDDLTPSYDGGDFTDATANIEVFAADKAEVKELAALVSEALNKALELEGFVVIEWFVGPSSFRVMQDGMTQQASLEFDYLIQPAN